MADQLQAIPLITPGFLGLNTAQAASTEINPQYASTLQNAVFDASGRVAARQGFSQLTSSAVGGGAALQSQAEYRNSSGTVQVISASATKIYQGTSTLTDITGSVVPTSGNWQFLNYNNVMIGIQAGQGPIVYTGTGTFATITPSSGTLPLGGCGVAAFGRLWILDADLNTIKYCNLLDYTAWTGTGAGSFNVQQVWTRGTDHVVGIAALANNLVVFGTNEILLYDDSSGASPIGLNPTNLTILETIEGTGLAARDSVQATAEGDLLFLSYTGIQSLGRLISSGKAKPINALDLMVHDYVNGYFTSENAAFVRSLYSPLNRFYLLLLPTSQRVFMYDTRQALQDGSLRASEWTGITWSSFANRADGTLVMGQLGIVGQYSGYTEVGASYQWTYTSPYLSLSSQEGALENRLKILKRFKCVLFCGGNTVGNVSWGVDFQGTPYTTAFSISGNIAEYGTAEYGTNGKYNVNLPAPSTGVAYAEYGSTGGLSIVSGPMTNSGRWMQYTLTATINGSNFAVQQFDAFVKIGVMV